MKIKSADAEKLISLKATKKAYQTYIETLENLLASDGEFSICTKSEYRDYESRSCSFDHYKYGMTFPREARFIQPMIDHWKAKFEEVEAEIAGLEVI